jgi:hypothetical protein
MTTFDQSVTSFTSVFDQLSSTTLRLIHLDEAPQWYVVEKLPVADRAQLPGNRSARPARREWSILARSRSHDIANQD